MRHPNKHVQAVIDQATSAAAGTWSCVAATFGASCIVLSRVGKAVSSGLLRRDDRCTRPRGGQPLRRAQLGRYSSTLVSAM